MLGFLLFLFSILFFLSRLSAPFRWQERREFVPYIYTGLALFCTALLVLRFAAELQPDAPTPLVLLLFVLLAVVDHWLLPRWRRDLRAFFDEVKTLESIAADSDWWSENWRLTQVEENRAAYNDTLDDLFCQWQGKAQRSFRLEALAALIFFGKSYAATRRMLKEHTEEPIRRWELLTGKRRPAIGSLPEPQTPPPSSETSP